MSFVSIVTKFIDIVLHIDKYLGIIIAQYGIWAYLILFSVLFIETGLVFVPFLPGDSLLFTAGTFAGVGLFNIWILYVLCVSAVILGDNLNYWIGHFVGNTIIRAHSRFINDTHVEKTKKFFHKYGSFAIILGRFMPIIRTFTPFLAGIGRLNYWKFLVYDIIGGFMWVSLFIFGGYYFGGLPFVKEHFSLIVILIILVSFIPVITQVVKHYLNKWFARERKN
jgi:membrane-associated protein